MKNGEASTSDILGDCIITVVTARRYFGFTGKTHFMFMLLSNFYP